MPLLGKIVVIKRNGTDGTEFPLTASCLFGRKLDCDIRIQLPQVSKEHCRIELNENKEVKRTHAVVIPLECMNTKRKRTLNETLKVYGCVVAITTKLILTNLSSVNPTLINGETLQQSERLKHGDLITIIDRSFRFEYPPAQTPKKKHLSTPGKGETVKVLQDQQVKSTPGSTEKKKSEHAKDTCLKDGSNLPACPGQSVGDQSNASTDSTLSPFSDLYNMVKRDLSTKPMWKSASVSNTPLSKQELEKVSSENEKPATPKSVQKKRRSSTARAEKLPAQVKTATPVVQGEQKRCSEGVGTPVPQKKTPQTTPQKFTTDQVAEQIAFESPSTKSPKDRRSSASQTPENRTTTQNPSEPTEAEEAEEAKAKQATRTSPRASAGKRFQVQDVSQEVVATPTSDDTGNDQKSSKKHKRDDLPLPAAKRKRVSFGGQLSPELFDKRLPPDSPLRRGATPWRRSLGFSQKSHSLLRRASTIGLMGYQLEEDLAESPAKSASPKRAASPAKTKKETPSSSKTLKKTPSPAKTLKKTPSPAKTLKKTPSPAKTLKKTPSPAKTLKKTPSPAKTVKKTPSPAKTLKKTPSPAKKSPSPKAKTPSPKNSKTPPPPSNPSTPASSRRLSNASVKSRSSSEESLLKTPTTHGRFSVSRISTPSPIPDPQKETKEEPVHVEEAPQLRATPRATLRRSSMKASARKSVLKSALDVVRSRRSGASRANLKVVSSWADIVKFGQAKPQMEGDAKKTTTKRTAVKHAKANKPKTPAHRLKDHMSTGHADSPASIVVGKAYLRSTRLVGAAPKVVCNVALFKKDMKMDEDLTGLSDIFKTPANSRRKSAFIKPSECPATPLGVEMTETSVMNTPEESGEMVVSPMSVASSAGPARYNAEAVTRLLQDDQDRSVIEEKYDSAALPPSDVSVALDMSGEGQPKNKKATPVQKPQRKPAQAECLTGVKRLMRTPKQKAEPVEDLRGKLLKTPKEPKPPQEESLEGIKELLDTPVRKGTLLEDDMAGVKKLTKTPKVINSPVVCAVALKRLVKTPKDKTEREEDFTGVKRLMKTPRQKKQQVEEDLTGVQEMMKTPQQKKQLVEEDLTGVLEMIKTPQQKKQLVQEDLGIQQMMKTPKQKKQLVEEDLTGVLEMMKTPKQKKQPVEEDLTGVQEMMKTPQQKKQLVQEDLGIQQMMKTPKQKKQLVEEDLTGVLEMMKTPQQKKQLVQEDLGIQQMMKTPKQKKQLVEEDLTGVQEIIKTPQQKKQPVDEDLTGVLEMMKTPQQTKQLVEEDLTVVQQMMKTPKQKSQLVEDLVGVKRLLQTPKEKGEPVENDFGIDHLMKTPKQKGDEAVLGSTMDAEFNSVSSGVLLLEDASEESEEKENICPVENVKNDGEAAVGLQIETEEGETSCQEVEASVASPEQEEQSNRSSPAKKTRRGAQVRTARRSQKSQGRQVDSDSLSGTVAGSEEETSAGSPKSVPCVRVRRGKSAVDLLEDVPVQTPDRKYTRGKIPKEQAEAQKPARASAEALKPRRGRKAERDVSPVVDLTASAEVEDSVKTPAPARTKRGRKEKHEPENPQKPEASVGVASESAELQPSEETEPPVKSNTRARRGRTTKQEPTTAAEVEESSDAVVEVEAVVLESSKIKSAAKTRRGRLTKKEMLKTSQFEESCEPTLTVMESDVKSSDAVVVTEPKLSAIAEDQSAAETVQANSKPRRGRAAKKETPQAEDTSKPTLDPEVLPEERTRMPVVKSRRGRSANPGALINQGAADESNIEPSAVEPEPKAEAPAVRSGRGAGNKQVKSQVEDAANGPFTETSAAATVAEEPAVKNVRGGRRTKQPKAQVLDDSQDSEPIRQLEASAARSSRGKRTAAVKDEPDAPVKRVRRGATLEAPPVVKPSRGRKAATKSEPEEVSEGSTSVVGPIEETSNETKVPGSATEETPLSEAEAKRGRGRIVKKAKVSTKDTSVREAEEAAAEEEPQQKMSRKKDEPAAKDDAETKQSVHPSVKGRKGRGAKEQEEPEKEKPAAEESIQPVRRGRAAASVGLEVAARQKRGQKRKDLEVEGDKIPDTESLPKRKRGKGAGAETQTDAAAAPGRGRRTAAKEAEETSVVEAEEAPKKEEKPVRGRRKAAPEDVPPQAEDPISERTTRRGTRGEKKAETDVASAPARRTRRK